MQSLTRRLLAGIGAVGILVSSAGMAQADVISNKLDASVDAAAEVMSLNVGGTAGSTQLYLISANDDGKQGCNLTGSTTLTLRISSDNADVATVSPSSVTFTSCGATPTLTVTPIGEGSATISASQTSNNTGATFSLAPATFTVNVAPAAPANAAPTIAVAGVSGGASYAKGSIPAATCQVTDEEDGNSSFAATLSAVTGPHASDGIGSQTASCSYADQGGLTASASETYSIVDPTAPTIGHTSIPALPDGSNGWYRSDVTVTWTVSEPESPNSLQETGCEDQSITADQAETTYSCSATSAGGSTGPVEVKIKRDATAPVVSGEDVNDTTWRNTALSEEFTASDATSGLASSDDEQFTLSASAESADASSPSTETRTVWDDAGNATTRSVSALIDKTAPVVSVNGVERTTYTLGSVPGATCITSDALSGVKLQAAPTTTGGPVGQVTVTCTGAEDHAGNIGLASVTFDVVYPWTGFFSPVDMGANVLNKAKAGSAIPLKFSLGGDRGLSIIAAGFPKTFSIPCSPSATVDQIEELAGTTSGLKYDPLAGQYNYTWKTSTTLAGKCVRLDMTLIDGSTHSANFQFTK